MFALFSQTKHEENDFEMELRLHLPEEGADGRCCIRVTSIRMSK
jgi:hypothetical protein